MEIVRDENMVAQKYISRPLLIDGCKFDLRIYAYVTSLNPLRIYLFDDGIVRFASSSYSDNLDSLSNQYIHLTNYSINKNASLNQGSTNIGLKWSLRQLWNYLAEKGWDVPKVMERIVDLVIKTFIWQVSSLRKFTALLWCFELVDLIFIVLESGFCEPPMSQFVVKFTSLPSICHELFGFDVILDSDLKPWLVEVNISPSMQCNSPVDYTVKEPLITDVLNLSGIQVPPPNAFKSARKSILQVSLYENLDCRFLDFRIKPRFHLLGDKDKIKSSLFLEKYLRTAVEVDPSILSDLTPSDLRVLIDTEDELDRRGRFQRVFPAPLSSKYLRYCDPPRYYNLLLDEWTRRFSEDRESGIFIE
ncbi:unnamed protein product [Soboliphyme baturini]|uniref:Tubulin polyglutamylase TTLL4 n=1 Tax=Soboliphyme baturini TaxID=241478 RepID=A0A183J645_9BILA|nr:unnamed protein product [Soboliphyme baturini]